MTTTTHPQTTQPIALNCPQCDKAVLWTEDYPHRPFCSERCRLIDLGEWADEAYKIPLDPQQEVI